MRLFNASCGFASATRRGSRLLVALVLVLSLSACSDGSNKVDASVGTQEKIINGTAVDSSVSPQIVALQITFTDGSTGLCSGTSIAPEQILTAGHCFPSAAVQVEVLSTVGIYLASSVTRHPGYSEAPELNAIFNDLAIVQVPGLTLPVLGIANTVPLVPGAQLIAYGYGLDENGVAGNLRSGLTTIAFATENHIFSTPFDGSQAETCNGDSGGPLIVAYTDTLGNFAFGIAGLVSTGTVPACARGDVTLFTNLQSPAVLDFIRTTAPQTLLM